MIFRQLLGVFILICGAAAVAAPHVIEAVIPASPIKVDGRINEKAWAAVPWQGDFTIPGSGKKAVQPTQFKVLTGKTGLYFAFHVSDKGVKSSPHEHDYAVWNDDCIEIFITPQGKISADPNSREHMQFVFNPSGARYDKMAQGSVVDSKWNPPWKVAAVINSNGYDAEVFIPYYSLNVRSTGKDWRLNISREDPHPTQPTHDLSVWSPTKRFADEANFGVLSNINVNLEPYTANFDNPVLVMKPEENGVVSLIRGELQGRGNERLAVKIMATDKNKRTVAFTSAERVLPAAGKMSLDIPMQFPASGDYTLFIRVLDDNGKVVRFIQKKIYYNAATLSIEVTEPQFRNNIYISLPDPKLVFSVKSLSGKGTLAGASLEVAVFKADRKLAGKTVKSPGVVENFSFDASQWTPGDYKVTAVMSNAGRGNGTLSTDFRVIGKPEAGNIVTMDRKRRVLINGKPVFIRGFIGGPGHFPSLNKSGYNLIQFYTLNSSSIENILKVLDDAHKNNLVVTFYPTHKIYVKFFNFLEDGKPVKSISAKGYENIAKMVNAVKTHPAFFGWYLYDEPRGAEVVAEMKKLYDFLCRIDPHHPVMGTDNRPGGCIDKKGLCDIHILDLYPGADKYNKYECEIESIPTAIRSMGANLPREGIWYCPQAYDPDCFERGPNDYRPLTFEETRCTVFGALAAGASAIIPYKIGEPDLQYFVKHPNSGIYVSPELKVGYLEGIGPELRNLEPVLLAECFAVNNDNKALQVCGKTLAGKDFVIAVNVKPVPTDCVLEWRNKKVEQVRVLGEKRSVKLKQGVLNDSFKPFEVHIYTDDGNYPEGVDLAAIRAKIKSELKQYKKK